MTPAEDFLAEALAASRHCDEPTLRAVARRIRSILAETPHAPGALWTPPHARASPKVLDLLEGAHWTLQTGQDRFAELAAS